MSRRKKSYSNKVYIDPRKIYETIMDFIINNDLDKAIQFIEYLSENFPKKYQYIHEKIQKFKGSMKKFMDKYQESENTDDKYSYYLEIKKITKNQGLYQHWKYYYPERHQELKDINKDHNQLRSVDRKNLTPEKRRDQVQHAFERACNHINRQQLSEEEKKKKKNKKRKG